MTDLTRWKVAFVGPTGVSEGSAFRLLYSYPTREQAAEHAESFRLTGMKVAFCDEQGHILDAEENGKS